MVSSTSDIAVKSAVIIIATILNNDYFSYINFLINKQSFLLNN